MPLLSLAMIIGTGPGGALVFVVRGHRGGAGWCVCFHWWRLFRELNVVGNDRLVLCVMASVLSVVVVAGARGAHEVFGGDR